MPCIRSKDSRSETNTFHAGFRIKPYLAKIFGQEPTFELVKKLQLKVNQTFDCVVAKFNSVEGHRSGKDDASLFEEHREILEMIQREFDAPDTRQAVIHTTGFLFFDDEGMDASRTLAWMLTGFVDVLLKNERTILKTCLWCRKYFVHKTKHKKKYCSDHCRYDYHNKGPMEAVR